MTCRYITGGNVTGRDNAAVWQVSEVDSVCGWLTTIVIQWDNACKASNFEDNWNQNITIQFLYGILRKKLTMYTLQRDYVKGCIHQLILLMSPKRLRHQLERRHHLSLVGMAFGVQKHVAICKIFCQIF